MPERTYSRREQHFGVLLVLRLRDLTSLPLDTLYHQTFQCNVPLGMESGRIANEQISASSSYSDGGGHLNRSRLHGDDNGWTPNLDSSKEYLRVLTQSCAECVCLGW